MTTHTLTIVDHPDDGEPIVSLGDGAYYRDVLLVPSDTADDRAALVDAVRDLTGPRDQLPADLRDDRRIAWVPDAGDGEGAWYLPATEDCRFRLHNEGWTGWFEGGRTLLRPPSAPATEDVPLHRLRGRRLPGTDWDIEMVSQLPLGGWQAHHPHGGVQPITVSDDGTVTVLKDTDR